MIPTNNAACYDDAFLIRVFVRLQRERALPQEKKLAMQTALYHNVYKSTNYILPNVIKREGDEANRILLSILAAIYHADRLLAVAIKEANEKMQVQLKVVAPTTIVYTDARSGCIIPYEEYEQRYYISVINKGVAQWKHEQRVHD